MKRWYVIQTKSNQEELAVKEVKNQNFKVFYPTYIFHKPNKRLKITEKQVKPLFPSYIFVMFDPTRDRWKCLNSTRGCVGLVGCGEEYVSPLPEGCVEEMIANSDANGHLPLKNTMDKVVNFHKGMKLGIHGDSYVGLVGDYQESKGNRVTLLLTLLNQKVRVILDKASVFPVKADGGSVSNQE